MANKLMPLNVVSQSNRVATGLVIFLHGSGDTGQGVKEWMKFLLKADMAFPHIKIMFPTAPMRPYTPLDGNPSHVWFDRLGINPNVNEHKESINEMGDILTELVKGEVSKGIPLNRIVIGGFSMGGAMALQMAYRFAPGIAGVFTLSSFLNQNSAVLEGVKRNLENGQKPCPLLMCHGDRDTLVPMEWGTKSHQQLTQAGVQAEFHTIKNAMHELKKDELNLVINWIGRLLPNKEADLSKPAKY